MRGLDNTAAEGVDGFKDFLQIIDELERVGAGKDWCKDVRKRLRESKLYFTVLHTVITAKRMIANVPITVGSLH